MDAKPQTVTVCFPRTYQVHAPHEVQQRSPSGTYRCPGRTEEDLPDGCEGTGCDCRRCRRRI